MPKITHVAKARVDQGKCRRCGTEIKKGHAYKWFALKLTRGGLRKNFCDNCRIRQSDLTTSEKLSDLYSAQERCEDAISSAETVDDMVGALNDAATEAREVAEAYRESVSNMPENLQGGSQADEMNEKADNIDTWAESLENAASELGSVEIEPEDDDECESCGRPYSEHVHDEDVKSKDKKKEAPAPATPAPVETSEESEAEESVEEACDSYLNDSKIEEARTTASDACDELSI